MLFSRLEEIAEGDAARIALRYGGAEMTYGELVSRVTATAERLVQRGVAQGSRVVIYLNASPEYLVVTYACARLGALAVTLDPSSTRYELEHVLGECGPALVVTTRALAGRVPDAGTGAVMGIEASDALLEDLCAPSGMTGTGAGRKLQTGDFLVQYTSGSTGLPKGVVQTQRGVLARMASWQATACLRREDEHLCALPLSHGFGMYCVALPALCSGGGLRLVSPPAPPDLILNLLEREAITCYYALPFYWQLLAQRARSRPADLSRLRIAMVGSAPVSSAVLEEVRRSLRVCLNNTYGTSETSMLMCDLRGEQSGRGNVAIGRPLCGVEVKMLDAQGQPADEGRLLVRTPGLARGYYGHRKPIDNDGWYDTGDIVRRAESGHYEYVGRITHFINVGGNKVSPSEVEAVIESIDGVREVVVAGVPDALTGQHVAAAVVSARSLTEAEVRTACQARLASYKVPKTVRFLASLPKGSSGKPLRGEVAAELQRSASESAEARA